ncbi:type II toxin-antitoxin system PemK/MazF family toxin [Gemelliphila palaticanis]|uniref:Type II toxin-antitoxin system PemK/MazF family toxin n=1 Tax=Gemelliphila palaticanis TaxID=81950 RepID=A0ABX2SZR7_9BACL|nr:type II toxin-antitoxin system PemK/MazF family toxin [Gemella palaticanis]MBF0715471.1 type II toxin-antitoxin system PemK/MazF family toxin [Gemella palaticanis]NYS47401.1 type II toxin-antitoxin system PemK/MazF family toxin [Gemella palaticanis]
MDILGVYLVDFKNNVGGEISGKHYSLILSNVSKKDNTLLVAPITSKKSGKRYRGGITIDCTKYQKNPKYQKAFIKIRKIREIDIERIFGEKRYSLDEEDKLRFTNYFNDFFNFKKFSNNSIDKL